MKTPALLAAAPLFIVHALGACTGMNAADAGACPAEQCLDIDENFTSSSALSANSGADATFVSEQSPNHASISSDNLVLSLVKSGSGYEGSTVYSSRWIQYGTVSASVRSGSTAPGVVSSIQLQSEDGSSIDLDWVGASSNRVQANYYTYNQMDLSSAVAPILTTNPASSFIEYKIVWLPDSLTWYANGLAVRTVNRRDTWSEGDQRYNFPSNPARLSFAIWDSSTSANSALTQEWAGTLQSDEPEFTMTVASVSVECYTNSTSQNAHSPNSDETASSMMAMRESDPNASRSASKDDLSDFGLDSMATKTSSTHSSSPTQDDGGDDLSKWLAGITSAAPRRQDHLGIGVILALVGLVVTLGI
ncbi:putative glycosidase CRH2 [Coemansia sp. RSA 2704]|nr:putative glycosidase CRH2 [Coemansia sp. RSA 2704]